jgi:ABC-type nitrate/sulfonate/bicarbonate transport system substrate-binding protein
MASTISNAQSPIKFCTSGGANLSFQPVYFAYTSGLFEFHGLSVERIDFVDDATAFRAFLDGSCEFVFSSAEIGIIAIAGGEEVRAVTSTTPWLDFEIVAGPQVAKLADLVGRTVAVSGLGELDHRSILHALETEGVDPSLVAFDASHKGATARARAVAAGQVDAAVSTSIAAARVMQGAPDLRIIYNAGAAFADRFLATALFVRTELLETQAGMVQAAVTSVIEANRSLMERDTAIESATATGHDAAVATAVYDALLSVDPPIFGVNGGIEPGVVAATVSLLAEMGKIDRSVPVERVVDMRFVEAALTEIGTY